MRNRALVKGFDELAASGPEMLGVDAAREGMHIAVPLALDLEETAPAGEHHVGAPQQSPFHALQLARGAEKTGQVVHAIVDGDRPREMVGESEAHRRVIPEEQAFDSQLTDQTIEQHPLRVDQGRVVKARGQAGSGDGDVAGGSQIEAWHLGIEVNDRFFEKEDRQRVGEAAHEVLRALENKGPTQMGQAEDGVTGGKTGGQGSHRAVVHGTLAWRLEKRKLVRSKRHRLLKSNRHARRQAQGHGFSRAAQRAFRAVAPRWRAAAMAKMGKTTAKNSRRALGWVRTAVKPGGRLYGTSWRPEKPCRA
jgi:hypothetical protein